MDPIVKYWESSYVCFYNNPLGLVDPLGLDGEKPGDKRTTKEGCNEVYNSEAGRIILLI